MLWCAISGSWRTINSDVERDVRQTVGEIIHAGNGIVTGGALGVDYIATDEALKRDPKAHQIKIIIPTPFPVFQRHFFARASEKVITYQQAYHLMAQLTQVRNANPAALIEMSYDVCNPETYYARNQAVIESSDRLAAFQVNKSAGTQDAIDKAIARNMPVIHKEYII